MAGQLLRLLISDSRWVKHASTWTKGLKRIH